MAEAMVTLDQDSALREKLIAAGHTQLERFSWSKCAKATLEVYGELVWGGATSYLTGHSFCSMLGCVCCDYSLHVLYAALADRALGLMSPNF
jgi:hypothetical protein